MLRKMLVAGSFVLAQLSFGGAASAAAAPTCAGVYGSLTTDYGLGYVALFDPVYVRYWIYIDCRVGPAYELSGVMLGNCGDGVSDDFLIVGNTLVFDGDNVSAFQLVPTVGSCLSHTATRWEMVGFLG